MLLTWVNFLFLCRKQANVPWDLIHSNWDKKSLNCLWKLLVILWKCTFLFIIEDFNRLINLFFRVHVTQSHLVSLFQQSCELITDLFWNSFLEIIITYDGIREQEHRNWVNMTHTLWLFEFFSFEQIVACYKAYSPDWNSCLNFLMVSILWDKCLCV